MRPDYAAKKGNPGSAPAGDSSPDYSAAPKAKAASAVPPTPQAHLPDGAPAGDGSPDYSARTGKGAGARPGSAAAAACGSCAGTATAIAALAQDMRGLQAFSRQMLQEVMGEMRRLRDDSAALEGHVRQLSAEVASLAGVLHGVGDSNGERYPAIDSIVLARSTCLEMWHNQSDDPFIE